MAWREEVGDPGGAEHLEFGQAGAVDILALQPTGVQFLDVVPDLLPCLLEKPPRADPVQRPEQSVEASLFGATLSLVDVRIGAEQDVAQGW